MALISATLLASNQLGGSSRLQQPGPERKFEDEVPSDDRRDEFTQRRVGEGDDAVAGAGALSDKPVTPTLAHPVWAREPEPCPAR
jgi:hypothetical protein